eukprot:SAG31_NODE_19638_length_595_cov_11.280242_1_plen_118_part_00
MLIADPPAPNDVAAARNVAAGQPWPGAHGVFCATVLCYPKVTMGSGRASGRAIIKCCAAVLQPHSRLRSFNLLPLLQGDPSSMPRLCRIVASTVCRQIYSCVQGRSSTGTGTAVLNF